MSSGQRCIYEAVQCPPLLLKFLDSLPVRKLGRYLFVFSTGLGSDIQRVLESWHHLPSPSSLPFLLLASFRGSPPSLSPSPAGSSLNQIHQPPFHLFSRPFPLCWNGCLSALPAAHRVCWPPSPLARRFSRSCRILPRLSRSTRVTPTPCVRCTETTLFLQAHICLSRAMRGL